MFRTTSTRRITLWQAASSDAAIALAEAQAKTYASAIPYASDT